MCTALADRNVFLGVPIHLEKHTDGPLAQPRSPRMLPGSEAGILMYLMRKSVANAPFSISVGEASIASLSFIS